MDDQTTRRKLKVLLFVVAYVFLLFIAMAVISIPVGSNTSITRSCEYP
jgi:hypothetical protein